MNPISLLAQLGRVVLTALAALGRLSLFAVSSPTCCALRSTRASSSRLC